MALDCEAVVPASVIHPDDEQGELEVTFEYTPGQAPSGEFGPPEDYDPGSGAEFECLRAHRIEGTTTTPVALQDEDAEKIIRYLQGTWEPPEPDHPDY